MAETLAQGVVALPRYADRREHAVVGASSTRVLQQGTRISTRSAWQNSTCSHAFPTFAQRQAGLRELKEPQDGVSPRTKHAEHRHRGNSPRGFFLLELRLGPGCSPVVVNARNQHLGVEAESTCPASRDPAVSVKVGLPLRVLHAPTPTKTPLPQSFSRCHTHPLCPRLLRCAAPFAPLASALIRSLASQIGRVELKMRHLVDKRRVRCGYASFVVSDERVLNHPQSPRREDVLVT